MFLGQSLAYSQWQKMAFRDYGLDNGKDERDD